MTILRGLVLVATFVLASGSARAQTPSTILLRGDRLAESKRRLAAGDAAMKESVAILIDSARSALDATPVSVMEKRHVPPSGNKHDFMSMAPYWWPDSTKPGGLPFIRHDGLVYPESRVDHDGMRLQKMINRVEALAFAYYFSGDEHYAGAAVRHLRVFFLDTATRMNPNLEYAQAVLGVNTGRGTGIIDTEMLPRVLDAIRLLEASSSLTDDDKRGLIAWSRDYLKWLRESANGKDEQAAKNNHGTFYDEQVVSLALFVGDTAFARDVITHSVTERIATQIQPDGRLPLELARTRPLHYSVFDLDAFTMLAELSRHVGVDLWHYASPTGGSIAKALQFVAPYVDPSVKFPFSAVREEGNDVFLRPFMRASAALGGAVFARVLEQVSRATRQRDYSRFGFPGII